jgi:hypothetical protein
MKRPSLFLRLYPCENTHRTRGDARIPFAIGRTELAHSVSQVAIRLHPRAELVRDDR